MHYFFPSPAFRLAVAFLLGAGLLGGACGVDPHANPREPLGEGQEPLHNAAPDSQFHAVGTVHVRQGDGQWECSGTLIGPRTVLTAAHCFASLARGCESEYANLANVTSFRMTPAGDWSDEVVYDAAEIRVAGLAYDSLQACLPNRLCGDENDKPSELNNGPSWGMHSGTDLVLVRLRLAPGQSEPASVARPMRVLTSITDNRPTTQRQSVHRKLDVSARFQKEGPEAAVPWLTGFGVADTVDKPSTHRRAGRGSFLNDLQWDRMPAAFWTCGKPTPVQHTESGIAVTEQVVRIVQASYYDASTGSYVYNGAYLDVGDSGGPLVLFGGANKGAAPELPADEPFVMGVASTGTRDAGSYRHLAFYAPTFSPASAFWIEWTLNEWDL